MIPSGLQGGTGVGVSPEASPPEQSAQVIGQAWGSSDGPGPAGMKTAIEELEEETEALRDDAAAGHARLESFETIVTRLAGDGNRGD